MFSYTDDAIVTSSPTGRHLSTVIRRPAAIGPLDWSEHADQVCKVLNELDSKAKANSLSLHLQTVGRVKRTRPCAYDLADPHGPSFAELIDAGYLSPIPGTRFMVRNPSAERIAELEKRLDDATTKLCAAQMLLDKAAVPVSEVPGKRYVAANVVEMTAEQAQRIYHLTPGETFRTLTHTFKRT